MNQYVLENLYTETGDTNIRFSILSIRKLYISRL
jgi:hypothetical protein